jgi:hypothetical protein
MIKRYENEENSICQTEYESERILPRKTFSDSSFNRFGAEKILHRSLSETCHEKIQMFSFPTVRSRLFV